MEYGSIERELHIDAAPEVVFEVLSSPEHIRDWWSAETEFEPVAGAAAMLTWTDKADLGKNPAKRLMGPLMSKMMKQSLDKSLAGIKALAEAAPGPRPDTAAPRPGTAAPAKAP